MPLNHGYVVKEGLLPEVSDIFSGTSLNITDSGRRFLGTAIESCEMKVSSWVQIIIELSTYAEGSSIVNLILQLQKVWLVNGTF